MSQTEPLTTKERPVFVPASRPKKLPYLCAAAECVTCKATVSGDWGLVPDECDTCDAERRARYYRECAQWADAEIDRLTERLAGAYASVNLLTEMLEAKAPQEATGSDPAALAAKVARTAFCVPGRHTVTITQEGLATIIESALILNGLSHEPAPAEATGLQDKIARAYGYLWHVNNSGVGFQFSPEKAAHMARRVLRDTMTHEQRGNAINMAATELFEILRNSHHE